MERCHYRKQFKSEYWLPHRSIKKKNVITEIAPGEPLKVWEITLKRMDAKSEVTPVSLGSAGNRQKSMKGETSL